MTKSVLSEQREADEALCKRLDRNAGWRDERWRCITDPNLLAEAASRIRALSEALQEACHERDGLRVPEWQPIETAPKDGTDVLLWAAVPGTKDYIAVSGYFDEMDDAWTGAINSIYGPFVNPTHWMRIPTPPGEK